MKGRCCAMTPQRPANGQDKGSAGLQEGMCRLHRMRAAGEGKQRGCVPGPSPQQGGDPGLELAETQKDASV